MLRQLAGCYYKELNCLLTVRIAQGLVHMGKGTIGLNSFFFDRNIMSLAGCHQFVGNNHSVYERQSL